MFTMSDDVIGNYTEGDQELFISKTVTLDVFQGCNNQNFLKPDEPPASCNSI